MLGLLWYYVIDRSENNLIRSIPSDGSQYVDIDGYSSISMPANPYSVLQGSKLSSLLYVIYCNEIPLLHNLVGSQLMTKLTDTQYHVDNTNITHNTIQYVDDSTNIISSYNTNHLQIYIDTFFHILEEYYNINKLLINSDKSKLLVITKPSLRHLTNNLKLNANKYIIE